MYSTLMISLPAPWLPSLESQIHVMSGDKLSVAVSCLLISQRYAEKKVREGKYFKNPALSQDISSFRKTHVRT